MTTMDEQPMTGLINSPTSQFTAVNVKEPQNGYHAFNGIHLNGALKKASDDWNHGQPRVTPPGHEKLTISTSTPKKDAWGPPPPSEQRPPHPAPSAHNEADPTHKRKRSKSAEDSPASNSFHAHPLPSKETPIASTESDGPRDDEPKNQPAPRNHYQADVPYRHFSSATEQTSAGESWSADSGPRPGHATSEEQLKEALQKASSTMDSQRDPHNQQDFNENSPEDDDQPMGPYPAYPIEGREGVYLRCDPRKRKRNFSNRTKTGCMTCRKRKKKCDEARPECNNCSRGGFVCAGYQAARGYPKTEQKQAPVLLQSKYEGGSKYEPGYSPQPWPQMGQQSRREPLPGYRGQQLRVDPQHGRPNGYEEEPPAASTSPEMMSGHSPEHNRLSTTGFNQQTPTPISANTNSPYDRGQKLQYERMGPLHDPAREIPTPQSGAHMFHPQMQSDGPHGNNVQVAAQLALSNLASTNRQRTQKEEMLVGKPFLPFDKELTLERERCKIACRTFNTNTGVSSEERIRLFREILQPRDMAVSPTHASPVTQVGQLGKNVIVEESFKCTYGYNIGIGQDVLIDHDVTIHDSCEVKIGDRCTIGAHVKIITESLYTDPQRRLGNRGQHFARSVTIGVDCWIGVGVIIHPGVKIGDGVTIVAGSVVDKDIPRYTIAAGNPAQVTGGAVGGANVHE